MIFVFCVVGYSLWRNHPLAKCDWNRDLGVFFLYETLRKAYSSCKNRKPNIILLTSDIHELRYCWGWALFVFCWWWKGINLSIPLIEIFIINAFPLKSNFWWLLPRSCFIATGFNQTDGVIANNGIEWSVATRFFPRPWWVLSYSYFWSSIYVVINIINISWFFTLMLIKKIYLHH